MKTCIKIGLVLSALAALSTFTTAQPPHTGRTEPVKVAPAPAQLPEKAVQDTLLAMLDAAETNDYANFVRPGSDEFKAGITQQKFSKVVEDLAQHLEKGYAVTYFGTLRRGAVQIHLWKLTFKEKNDETLGELSIKDGKVEGFWVR